jgi:hypothetical protein
VTGDGTFRPIGHTALAVSALARHDALAASAARCFADEVAIDFPSVAPAVERIRRGLVHEEHGASLSAVLWLSRHQAHTGTTTPLTVPVRATCRRCGGRGESWADSCHDCGGSGAELRTHTVQVRVPAGVADGAVFCFTVTPLAQPATRIELRILVS